MIEDSISCAILDSEANIEIGLSLSTLIDHYNYYYYIIKTKYVDCFSYY